MLTAVVWWTLLVIVLKTWATIIWAWELGLLTRPEQRILKEGTKPLGEQHNWRAPSVWRRSCFYDENPQSSIDIVLHKVQSYNIIKTATCFQLFYRFVPVHFRVPAKHQWERSKHQCQIYGLQCFLFWKGLGNCFIVSNRSDWGSSSKRTESPLFLPNTCTHARSHTHTQARTHVHTHAHTPLPIIKDNKQSAGYNCSPGSVAPLAVWMCTLMYYCLLMVIKINDEGLMSPSKKKSLHVN